jgi:hypothetical protein
LVAGLAVPDRYCACYRSVFQIDHEQGSGWWNRPDEPVEPAREQTYKRRIAELEAENAELKSEVAALKSEVKRLAELVAALSKNSSNSSKPPSSDIVKPPKGNAALQAGQEPRQADRHARRRLLPLYHQPWR